MKNLMTTKLSGKIEKTSANTFSLTAYRGEFFSFSYLYPTLEKAVDAAKKYNVEVTAKPLASGTMVYKSSLGFVTVPE